MCRQSLFMTLVNIQNALLYAQNDMAQTSPFQRSHFMMTDSKFNWPAMTLRVKNGNCFVKCVDDPSNTFFMLSWHESIPLCGAMMLKKIFWKLSVC